MVNRNKRTVIRRIPKSLDSLLGDLQRKNNLKFTEAADMAAELLVGLKTKKDIIKNIRREIEF